MNQMPQMPGMPSPEAAPAVEPSVELQPPVHQEPQVSQAPIIKDGGATDSEVKVLIPKEGIEVVATRKGFYNQNRYETGDVFFVTEFVHLGEWMRCTDKQFELKRVEMLKNKKAKAKK